VLVVQMSPHYERFLAGDFARFTPLAPIETKLGPRKTRQIGVAEAQGYRRAPRTADYLADVGD